MSKLFFLTFGAGSQDYHDAVERICSQARSFEMFDAVIGLTEKDLMADTEFWTAHSEFILKNKRGYGYWIWRPYFLHKIMKNQMDFGDIILFLDAGCELNVHGKEKMREYIELVKRHHTLSCMVPHKEKTWSKMDLIKRVGCEETRYIGEANQIEPGVAFYLKTQENLDFLFEVFSICVEDDYHYVDDSPSVAPNDPSFVEHRHDQSIFGLLLKKHNKYFITFDNYPREGYLSEMKHMPIIALRNRRGRSLLPW